MLTIVLLAAVVSHCGTVSRTVVVAPTFFADQLRQVGTGVGDESSLNAKFARFSTYCSELMRRNVETSVGTKVGKCWPISDAEVQTTYRQVGGYGGSGVDFFVATIVTFMSLEDMSELVFRAAGRYTEEVDYTVWAPNVFEKWF